MYRDVRTAYVVCLWVIILSEAGGPTKPTSRYGRGPVLILDLNVFSVYLGIAVVGRIGRLVLDLWVKQSV